MNGKQPDIPLAFRVLGSVAGLGAGTVLGLLVLVAAIIFSGRSFGLGSVLPGAAVGAAVGAPLGWVFPIRAGRIAQRLFSNL